MLNPNLRHRLRELPAHWRWGLGGFLAYRLALTLWGILLWALGIVPPDAGSAYYFGVPPIRGSLAEPLLGIWQRWDAIHYTRIASGGYSAAELSGFHPLFPLLGGAVSSALGVESLVGLLVVANLGLAAALVLLFRLVENEFGQPAAEQTVVALLAFPGAFFLAAPYAESLTLLLALAALLSAKQSRWLLAFILGIAAGLSHSTSLPLTAPLAVLAVQQGAGKAVPRRLALLGAALGPFAGTGLFLAWRIDQGFPAWVATQGQLWGVSVRAPWDRLGLIGEVFRSPYFVLNGWVNLVGLALSLLALWWWVRQRRVDWAAWQAAMLIFLLSVDVSLEPLASWVRHLLVLPPLFVALPALLRGRWPRRLALAAALGTQLYLVALFTMWIWVA